MRMMHKTSISLSATLMMSLSTVVLAAPVVPSASELAVQHGVDFARKQEYGKAIEVWKPLADRGNSAAQNNLGVMYELGHGVQKDYAQAVVWFRKAAQQGQAAAQFNLGYMYANGEGVAKDEAQAKVWFAKSAMQGYVPGGDDSIVQ
jgi:uncharacterized protein